MNYKEVLLNRLLPFYTENAPDYECGGIFTGSDKDGDKRIWLLARALWTYSSVCNLFGAEEKYLRICESAFSFLRKCTAENGKLPFIVTRDGEEIETKDNFHSECYAAMAVAVYYKVCKRQEVWEYAKLLFGYATEFYEKKICSDEKYITMNRFAVHSLFHFTSGFMREIDPIYEEEFRKSEENMMSGGYFDSESGITFDYKPSFREENKRYAEVCMPGDIFVAAWVLLSENYNDPDGKRAQFAKEILDAVAKIHMGDPFGLSPLAYNIKEKKNIDTYRFWPQWEALVAYRLAEKVFGDKKYASFAEKTETALGKYLMNTEKKEFYSELDENAQGSGEDVRGELFHIPRALMMLDKIEKI